MSRHAHVAQYLTPPPTATWETLRRFMHERCGVNFTRDQSFLMEARLGPVAKKLDYDSVEGLVRDACRQHGPAKAQGAIVDAMTTHETYFFRDPLFWRGLRDTVVPRLHRISAATKRPVRVWCAACSTGQEVLSLGMTIVETDPQLWSRMEVVATDVSEQVVRRAEQGIYDRFECGRGLKPSHLLRFFEQVNGGHRAKPELHSAIQWRTANLVTDEPPLGTFDVVLLRNVLLYFDDDIRDRVLKRIASRASLHGVVGVSLTEQLPSTQVASGWYEAEGLR